MVKILGATVLALLSWGNPGEPLVGQEVAWQEAKVFAVPTQADPAIDRIVDNYLDRLESLGYDRQRQGIWLQSEWAYLGYNQANNAFPAASLTKIATSVAALATWPPDHRFTTRFYADGPITAGVLQGNLLIAGDHDPLFVWEEAIAVGNALNRAGIREVTGDLVVVGNFAMNFEADPAVAGALFKQAVDESQWSAIVNKAFGDLPSNTPRPQVKIAGTIQTQAVLPPNLEPLLEHQSLPLAALLKQMNIYSNNDMAEMLAQAMGGAAIVAQTTSRLGAIPAAEIQLQNGSGLGVDNRLSPRAVTKMYQVLAEQLQPHGLGIDDIFPVMGRDRQGTLEWRSMPQGLTVKTGTLNTVSALAGIIPTQERGTVWFAIINNGPNFDRLRVEQDRLLQQIAEHWQILPENLNPGPMDKVLLGDPARNLTPQPSES
ncbi:MULTISPECIES: D-alanyl-D-alanine carboxypeptidase/D-alanyl-D-alanine-endopeptidase [Synechocystis]|uniref:D-alanyl-D-alanine carboxypeptidase/D-alanyl-D-alanine-endopeptidase n=1 Tax=Synechocystis salina LEGE 00031 TaxID=1828736 RepID=A0ABR9VQZ2_9SYNC|nr:MULTISPECIES: D-alanyl-D-alanine carboxypeptidase/D-alanyl-D-alanine-endopeptidase [Synechocystis]MBE9194209.1 D-alanyl-D-alanine carboxypeptidase/D-alanyl-D-alanine-endopeptidase [Synechocystis sp. LEGE 06083]MBE9240507.1 D-alanyl-D-alanine carboxypeptidase/D-alanyl-D-alanine-endopeptidase [Synechocystis salina LEGE 00041]MBE9253740.1 D-alanyl-D-alanine carboxypeptidase/D-alanyl-D-alanine-endopeptidase [Synechocystis salina LEGE 00031]